MLEAKLVCKSVLIKELNLSSKIPLCTPEESRNATSQAIMHFVTQMQITNDLGCPIPCSHSSYSPNMLRQHSNAFELFTGESRTDDYMLYFYYSTLESDEESENLIVDFPNLVANTGGFLGLFLGLSCLNIYLFFLDLAQKKMHPKS